MLYTGSEWEKYMKDELKLVNCSGITTSWILASCLRGHVSHFSPGLTTCKTKHDEMIMSSESRMQSLVKPTEVCGIKIVSLFNGHKFEAAPLMQLLRLPMWWAECLSTPSPPTQACLQSARSMSTSRWHNFVGRFDGFFKFHFDSAIDVAYANE